MEVRQANEGRKRIVVIAPHSDDAELGLGAYINNQDADVDVAVLSWTDRGRKTEAYKAAELLGIRQLAFLDAAFDSKFNVAPTGDLVRYVEERVFGWGHIDELFIPLESFHDDHVVTHKACIAALRPHKGRVFPRRVYCYEYPANTAWGPQPPSWGRVYAPVMQTDIDQKMAALKCYGSQWVSDDESLFGRRGVMALASMRGAECLTDLAELFYLVRGIA